MITYLPIPQGDELHVYYSIIKNEVGFFYLSEILFGDSNNFFGFIFNNYLEIPICSC
jgi:hypothetical protein